jgi:hypothetical protein
MKIKSVKSKRTKSANQNSGELSPDLLVIRCLQDSIHSLKEVMKSKLDNGLPSKSLDNSMGVTVAQLKRFIADWPEECVTGEPTEVWISTGEMMSSPCVELQLLNLQVRDGRAATADLLLLPSYCTGKVKLKLQSIKH